jgi:NAD(P)H-dependent FMN reductase
MASQEHRMSGSRAAALNVALIYGSTRRGRFCDTVASWVAAHVEADADLHLQHVDPVALGMTDAHETSESETWMGLKQSLARADSFIVVTPEYNHGYPAPLKAPIDAVSEPWHAKPVAFVGYGGVSGGLRAIEQLRQVFAEVHAMTIRDSVSFASAWEQFDKTGVLLSPERAARSMARMLIQLKWWAGMLREARIAQPYSPLLL